MAASHTSKEDSIGSGMNMTGEELLIKNQQYSQVHPYMSPTP